MTEIEKLEAGLEYDLLDNLGGSGLDPDKVDF